MIKTTIEMAIIASLALTGTDMIEMAMMIKVLTVMEKMFMEYPSMTKTLMMRMVVRFLEVTPIIRMVIRRCREIIMIKLIA